MEGSELLVLYLLAFAAIIVTQIFAVRKKSVGLWIFLYLLECGGSAGAALLCWYYNGLPGGMFGSFTYMGEVLVSLAAAVLYGISFLISLAIGAFSIYSMKDK